ncbi:MAG: hypothetical protein JSU66_12785 [Deltaproteobacteria bacterium]|nr:MAG: hypothetical protein JSU66_12785 [Deltaproteobacteria bacterium]
MRGFRATFLACSFLFCAIALTLPDVATATPRPFTGTLTITVVERLGLATVFAEVSGQGTADVTGSTVAIPAGAFVVSETKLLGYDAFFDSVRLSFTNLAGTFLSGAGLYGGFGGSLAFAGTAFFDPETTFLGYSFGGGTVSVPVGGVGRVGGTGADMLTNAQGKLTLKIAGGRWTTSGISPSGYLAYFDTYDGSITSAYAVPTSITARGTDDTSGNVRHLQLVTPVSVQRIVASPYQLLSQDVPGYARLELAIDLPEPSRIALHVAAAAALLGVGLRRARP